MRKKPQYDLRNYHTLFLETGLVIALLLFIVAMRVEWRDSGREMDLTDEQEVVEMEEVVQTEQEKELPPPERPQVPVEVPNDEVLDDYDINLDADMELDRELPAPPPSDSSEEEEDEEEFFKAVEHMPEPIGGIQGIHDRINYPKKALRAGIEGSVHVQFYVNRNGEVEDPKILRGLEGGCNEEALRVIKATKFTPGRQRGRPVKVLMGQVIHFRIKN